MRTCSLEKCPRPHYAAGYCNPHWRRWKRNGDPGLLEIQGRGRRICSFCECGRPASCKQLCASHYAQQRRHGRTVALNDRIRGSVRDDQGRKRCATCKQWKAIDQFLVNRRLPDGLKTNCVRCDRHRALAARYGVTIEAYERLSASQEGVCAICGGLNESGRALAVDHNRGCCPGDKACGRCIRGLLCGKCNIGVGQFDDDPARLRAAAVYVELTR